MAPFERGQALLIGVGIYNDSRWDVPAASNDARSLHELLVDPDRGGYGRGQTELLLDEAATHEEIVRALRRLADRCDERSVAVIGFTGHGALGDDGLYSLATSDTRFVGQGIAAGTGLSVPLLVRALREIPAGQLLLLVNACSSGELLANVDRDAVAPEAIPVSSMLPDRAADELLATGAGRAIITASRADQLSYFQPLDRHSYFGQALLDAFAGSAASAYSGYIGLYELYEGVYRQVRDVTLRRLGVAQEPMLTVVQGRGPFPLARYPRSTGEGAPLRQQLAGDLPVRAVPQNVVQAIGQGATAINAGDNSTINVNNSKLIDFGSNSSFGNITIGDVAGGDIIKTTTGAGTASAAPPPDPLRELSALRDRVEAARNVDEYLRDEAAAALYRAQTALARNDRARAYERLGEALAILAQLDNGYVRSLARKIQTLRDSLA
jgi:hypothetical protein